MATSIREHHAPSNSPRLIRVFISSTFRDMQAEREELVKHVFPQLRKLCESRGVIWGEVDLRWGISDEQKAEGKVLPICLAEIQRCRPYFIGLLGQRYGWVPEQMSPQLLAQEPWLEEYPTSSVTELEILHGVLNDPEMASHAFFYLRHPAYLEMLSSDERMEYEERPTAAEIERLGQAEAERRADERREKLEGLKRRIKTSGLPVREDYSDPRELGQLVLRDFTALIDRLYPEDVKPDLIEREVAGHEDFARSRAVVVAPEGNSGAYVGREEYFDILDAHAAGAGSPLIVLGESGSGKSALLSNWALRYRLIDIPPPASTTPPKVSFWGRLTGKHPSKLSAAKPPVVLHFVSATPDSADWAVMLLRLIIELNRHFNINQDIPDNPDHLREAFAKALRLAAAKGRIIIVIDALDQLEDRDGALDLVWLPDKIPANVRLVMSTLPGRPLAEIEKRGWSTMNVQPLTIDERRRLIVTYLEQYRKSLSDERVDRIASTNQTANPLYLRALLEELRLWGDHDTLDQQIDEYLAAPDGEALYERILARYERDYERDKPGLVRDAMSLLWAARRGLSEAEILDMLGTEGYSLPRAHWSPLYLALEQSLINRLGLIEFSHDYLRRAVEKRYLPNPSDRRAIHERLADYFQSHEWGTREIDELPWQLAQAESWQRLYDLLGNLNFFAVAWQANQYEFKARWADVEAHSPLRLIDAYQPVLQSPVSAKAELVWDLATLLADTGRPKEALTLRQWLGDRFRQEENKANLQASLISQANILYRQGDLDGAMALYQQQERISRELDDKESLAASLGNQAVILKTRGELEQAMALHRAQERLCRDLDNKEGLVACLGNQANILFNRGDVAEAMALYQQQERICRELGNKEGLRASWSNQAVILHSQGNLDESMSLLEKTEILCRELNDKEGLYRSLGNRAVILFGKGDVDGAMALHQEEERICRELGNLEGIVTSLRNQAVILLNKGYTSDALLRAEEAYRLANQSGLTVLSKQIRPLLDRLKSR